VMDTGATGPQWLPPAISAVALVVLIATMPAEWSDREMPIVSRSAAMAEGVPDASGRTRPFLVHDAGERWLPPLSVYPAVWLRMIGLPEKVAVRLPAVVAAAASAVLVYLLALILFRDLRTAILATALLMVSPAWLNLGRTAGGDLLLVPLVLGWLIAARLWRERPRVVVAVIGGLLLGMAAWTQPAGVLSVPVYFAIGMLLMQPQGRDWRGVMAAGVAAAVPFLAYGIWFVSHPDTFLDSFGRWAVHPAHIRSPWDGVLALTNWAVLARRSADYWSYLNPTFLFDGRSVFGAAMALLLGAGWWSKDSSSHPVAVLTAGLVAAPLVAVLLDLPRDAGLVVMIAPLGALIAASGAVWLLDRPRLRVGSLSLLALAALGAVRTLAQ
jgi:4-amino-4-deoxy-L-arabinose transferase-like glycosyltransferase